MGESMCDDINNNYGELSVTVDGETQKTSYCMNAAAIGSSFVVAGTNVVVEMVTSDASKFGFLMEYESSEKPC